MRLLMKTLLLSLATVAGLAAPASAQDADVTGKWDLTISTAQGSAPGAVLTIKKEGDKLTGLLASPQGELPAEVTIKAKDVSIVCTAQVQGTAFVISFSGKVDGNTMGGPVDFGGRGGGTWSATRADGPPPAKDPAPAASSLDVTGSWTFDVTTSAGSGTPTMQFKQTGEKLTGHYSGQLGEADLAGTVKGSAIEFAFDISADGNAIHIVYAGTAEKDAMKGTVKLGDLGEGTFTAKKKPQ
jgi:hypothetical protein